MAANITNIIKLCVILGGIGVCGICLLIPLSIFAKVERQKEFEKEVDDIVKEMYSDTVKRKQQEQRKREEQMFPEACSTWANLKD